MTFHVTMETQKMDGLSRNARLFPDASHKARDEEEAMKNIKEAITAWMWTEDQKTFQKLPLDQTSVLVAV